MDNTKSTSLIFKENVMIVEKFIKYNINTGKLNERTTLKELLNILNEIKEWHIPAYAYIEQYVNQIYE